MALPRRVRPRTRVLHAISGPRPPEVDPASAVARRLSLRPARNEYDEPWRHWLLRYLAALAAVSDYERTNFGRDEARIALETLASDTQTMLNELRTVRNARVPRWRAKR